MLDLTEYKLRNRNNYTSRFYQMFVKIAEVSPDRFLFNNLTSKACFPASETAVFHHLQDYGRLPSPRLACDYDSPVGGQIRGQMFTDFPIEPVSTQEERVCLRVRNLEEKGLQSPVELAILMLGSCN